MWGEEYHASIWQVCDRFHGGPTMKRLADFAAVACGRNWPISTFGLLNCCCAKRPSHPIPRVAKACCNRFGGIAYFQAIGGRQCDDATSSKLLSFRRQRGRSRRGAQQPGKTYRIGWLQPSPVPDQWLNGFRQGLQEFNYIEGKNIAIEYRWGASNFDNLSATAAELVTKIST